MKTPLVSKQRVEKRTFKSWALIVLLVTVALFCWTSGEIRVNDEVEFGTNPNKRPAPAAALSDSSGASTSAAQTVASSSNPSSIASTGGSQSNPANEPPQQFTPMYTRSMHRGSRERENMAVRRTGSLAEHPAEPSASSQTFRSAAGPLPQPLTETSASSHAFPAISGNPVPASGSPELDALEGLLHINLPSSLGQQQQIEQGEQETIVILDAVEAKRGPGHRTVEGEFKRDESATTVEDIRDILDWVLAMNAPRGREKLDTYGQRILKGVKEELRRKGLSKFRSTIQERNWWKQKVKFAYDMHRGAGPSTLTND